MTFIQSKVSLKRGGGRWGVSPSPTFPPYSRGHRLKWTSPGLSSNREVTSPSTQIGGPGMTYQSKFVLRTSEKLLFRDVTNRTSIYDPTPQSKRRTSSPPPLTSTFNWIRGTKTKQRVRTRGSTVETRVSRWWFSYRVIRRNTRKRPYAQEGETKRRRKSTSIDGP